MGDSMLVIDWSRPGAPLMFALLFIAILIAQSLARGYVSSVYADVRRLRDGMAARCWGDVFGGGWWAVCHAIAAWALACALFAAAAGAVGISVVDVDSAAQSRAWLLGGSILLPIIAAAQRFISRHQQG